MLGGAEVNIDTIKRVGVFQAGEAKYRHAALIPAEFLWLGATVDCR